MDGERIIAYTEKDGLRAHGTRNLDAIKATEWLIHAS